MLKHQFDLTSFLVSEIMSRALSDLYGEALSQLTTTATTIAPEGTIAASIAKFTKALAPVLLYGNRLASKVESARARSEGIQDDVTNIVRSWIVGNYHRDFDLFAVFVSEEGRAPHAHSWPSSGTEVGINVANAISNNNFTIEQFLQDPLAGFMWFDSLPSRLVEDFYAEIQNMWAAIRDEQNARQETSHITPARSVVEEVPPPTIAPGSPEQPELGPAVSPT